MSSYESARQLHNAEMLKSAATTSIEEEEDDDTTTSASRPGYGLSPWI